MSSPVVVLVLASGADWESEALSVLAARRDVVVLKRCVDVADVLATAASGQAQVAVLALGTPGLDATAIGHLRRHGVRAVAVVGRERPVEPARAEAARWGIRVVLGAAELGGLADAVVDVEETTVPAASVPPAVALEPGAAPPARSGSCIAVWGPAGAPGRSTVAAALAGELARRGRRVVLVDADPYGGTIAQQLGILDEVSGLLAASRLAAAGQLRERLTAVQRALDPRLTVVTGLPRPDRWAEVRAGTVADLVELAREGADVVVDTGFCLEEDPARDLGTRPGRNATTLEALDVAEEVIVVGGADPVGLARLARGVAEVAGLAPGARHRVAVNRMRPSLGWSERQIAEMVLPHAAATELHVLPDDPAAVDRALVTGRTLLEGGEGPLTRAVARLADASPPPGGPVPAPAGGFLRRRTAGRVHRQ